MNIAGLTDSLANLATTLRECVHCAGTSRIAHGICLSCLLRSGAESEEELAEEDFDAVLTALPVVDTHWRLGNYEILEEIGRGGMGVIYRARQRHSRRIVALKRVLGYHADSRETLARFRREAEAAASLDHPNILPIYEVGESAEGVPFFSMKYASGGNLQEVGPALRDDPREIVRLMAKVTRAVQHAHRQGILHRDLKPGNILLDSRGEPLVSDFGLAKWLDTTSDLTRTLTIFGTPGYIAPEQAEGPAGKVTPVADVYSLGAILFDLLAGRPPFLGEHALAVIRQAAEKPAPKLRSLVRTADRDLETICAKCIERDPAARYRAAGDLAEDLESWLEGRSIMARPVAPPARVWRWTRRNPLLAGSIAGCILLAIVAGARQFQSRRLQTAFQARVAAEHSVRLTPVFDLDNIREDENLTAVLGNSLRNSLAGVGDSTVHYSSEKGVVPPARSETVKPDSASERSIASATVRSLNGRRRVALRLMAGSNNDAFFHHVFELEANGSLPSPELASVARQIYSLLEAPDLSEAGEKNNDPGLRDKETRDLITAASELSDRRSQVDLRRAETILRHALARQPQSSMACWQLARALTMEAAFTSDHRSLPEAEAFARRAVKLDPVDGDAHFMLAVVHYHLSQFRAALDQLQFSFECKGIFSRGTNVAAQIYDTIGRPDKSMRWHLIGQKTEPHPAEDAANNGDSWSLLGADEQAQRAYEYFSELHPEKPEGWMGLSRLLLFHDQPEKAREICLRNWKQYTDFAFSEQMMAEVEFFTRHFAEATALYEELYAHDADGGGRFYGAVSYRSALGRLKTETDKAAGRQLLEEAQKVEVERLQQAPEDPGALYRMAAIEASLEQSEAALAHLQRAFSAGWIDDRSLRLDPRFDSLRASPDFARVSAAMRSRVTTLREAAPALTNNDSANPTRKPDHE